MFWKKYFLPVCRTYKKVFYVARYFVADQQIIQTKKNCFFAHNHFPSRRNQLFVFKSQEARGERGGGGRGEEEAEEAEGRHGVLLQVFK